MKRFIATFEMVNDHSMCYVSTKIIKLSCIARGKCSTDFTFAVCQINKDHKPDAAFIAMECPDVIGVMYFVRYWFSRMS